MRVVWVAVGGSGGAQEVGVAGFREEVVAAAERLELGVEQTAEHGSSWVPGERVAVGQAVRLVEGIVMIIDLPVNILKVVFHLLQEAGSGLSSALLWTIGSLGGRGWRCRRCRWGATGWGIRGWTRPCGRRWWSGRSSWG